MKQLSTVRTRRRRGKGIRFKSKEKRSQNSRKAVCILFVYIFTRVKSGDCRSLQNDILSFVMFVHASLQP
jgi:hypothetical protein